MFCLTPANTTPNNTASFIPVSYFIREVENVGKSKGFEFYVFSHNYISNKDDMPTNLKSK